MTNRELSVFVKRECSSLLNGWKFVLRDCCLSCRWVSRRSFRGQLRCMSWIILCRFQVWYFSDIQVQQNVRWQDLKWCKMTRQVWVWRGSGWSCLPLNAVTVFFFFFIIFFWTQSGKHESWFSHCWDDSESGDDCRTTQWTPTRLSPLWAECILYWGFCPRAAQLFLISLILLHQRGDCLTLLSRTQSDLGSVRHSHPRDDFRWIQQPKERCKLLLDRAQSSTREPKPPHYSLNCSTVGCRHSEDIHTVNVCFSAAQFSCKLTITSLQLHLNDLMLHNDRFVCGVNAVNGHSGQMLLLCLEWLCSHVPDILQI